MISYALLHHVALLLKRQTKITIRAHQHVFVLDTPRYCFKACMHRAQSYLYIEASPHANYPKTPLNLALEKYASNAKILDATLENDDRILKIALECACSYKKTHAFLQLEFTGRHSNAILLDAQGCVLEALHFISAQQSYRPVIKTQALIPLRKLPFARPPLEPMPEQDLLDALNTLHTRVSAQALEQQKIHLRRIWVKKEQMLRMRLRDLPSATQLLEDSTQQRKHASLILAHLHHLDPRLVYAKELYLEDQHILLPPHARTLSDAADKLFKMAKKSVQRANHIALQVENILSKITFLQAKLTFLESARLEDLRPLRTKSIRHSVQDAHLESFEIEGVRVLIGRNQKENREILKMARARDIWAHVQDQPGAHMVIFSHPHTPSQSLLYKACTLLAKLTYPNPSKQALRVRIDHTQKKYVRFAPQTIAQVFYTNFSTTTITL
ncbi:NFACT family protein [Helicobacter baculiformis]|uniref:NFACT family protein n=1 Tax=Helicobacter baculiformis TaxID=427351 RepID=A0ABV7ZI88_9HELI|nr:NFACT family protein [Helicobacter baculiformis]